MSQERDTPECVGGEEFHELNESGLETHELGMMVTITNPAGGALPLGCMTVANLARLLQERTGVLPCHVSVMNDREALIEFDQKESVVEVSRNLHGPGTWGELEVNIGCVMSGKARLLEMFRDREEREGQREEIRQRFGDLKRDQEGYQAQLTEVVQALQDKISLIEQKSNETMAQNSNHYFQNPGFPPHVNHRGRDYKVSKPPDLPHFSGTEPVPREEGSFEQWIFQVRGSSTNHTEDAIRSGIINSVRGEARDLVEYVGFSAPLEAILSRLEGRFRKTRSTDRLQYEFFQLGQEKGEGVQQYAGRLENQYKKLKAAFPDRYGDAQLKERLFFGMIAGLRNATRYVYKQPDASYEVLLKATKEAELEFTESRSVAARMKAVGVLEKGEGNKLQELNNKIENLAATLKANNVRKIDQKSASAPCSPMKQIQQSQGPPKSKGSEVTSHGPFRQGRRPIQCHKCGGWGHGWKDCPSPGNIDWRRWTGDNPPPVVKEVPRNQSS